MSPLDPSQAARRNLKVVEEALDADAKNYHAWSHRGWVVARFGLWEEEKAYASRMIDADVRNNSAWSARWHCVVGRAAAEAAASDAASDAAVPSPSGAFYTLVPIRPRSRCERRSLRTFAGASLRPTPLGFNPRPRRLSTPSDAFQLHPDVRIV